MALRIKRKQDNPADEALLWLISSFRQHLHIPDPLALYVLFGAVAANMIEGDPVWPMLVGPPSSGKTELLNSLLNIDNMHEGARISNESAFLSGTSERERAKSASGGLLRKIGTHGGLILNDFTSVLTLKKENLDAVLSVFRETYSGRWTRDIGSEGGRSLSWVGKVAYFAGVTGAIDLNHETNASMGERWIYYRMHASDSWERTKRAANKSTTSWREELRECVKAFFAGADLEFGKLEPRRALTDIELLRLHRMGEFAAACRSSIVRDRFSREIVAAKETEQATRLITSLGQLLVGMERIGVHEDDIWRGLRAVALDSMPKLRRVVVDQCRVHGVTDFKKLAREMGCHYNTVERTVEDLAVHGVVTKEQKAGGWEVKFTDWVKGVDQEWRR